MSCLSGAYSDAAGGLGLHRCFGDVWQGCSKAAVASRRYFGQARQIKLSVGGSVFWVHKEEMLAAGSPLISEAIEKGPGDDGEYFLDRDGTYFHFTLDYIHRGARAFTRQTSSGEPAACVSFQVRRHLLLEAKVLGLSDMQRTLEGLLNPNTPPTSASGRQAREAIQNGCYEAAVVRSESDLPIVADISGEGGASLKGFEKFVSCCKPLAWTIIPPVE